MATTHPLTATSRRTPAWLFVVLALVALAALAVPLLLVRTAPSMPAAAIAKRVVAPRRVVPQAEVPSVEPIQFQSLAPQDARAYNASIPFSTDPNPAARPFRIFGSGADQARAVDCLAAALIYEAGDDPSGERAVAQVVLNRVRHPAFPKTVCGVVFQGSERRTGCQFTFACDGAMMRAVVPAAWERARSLARAALNGAVDRRVGHATHYHTDWVVPYWSSSLDKITEVHTHLFFRWSGWWGTPPAFAGQYRGVEPAVPQLALLSEVHRAAAAEQGLAMPEGGDTPLPDGTAIPLGLEQDQNTFLATLDPRLGADAFPALAAKTCGDRAYCKFMAWSSKAVTPAALPVTPVQQRAMAFSYLRDRAFGFDKPLWNCAEYKRADSGQCMKAQVSMTLPATAAAPPMTYDATPGAALRAIAGEVAPSRPTGPDPLTGIRRRVDPAAPVRMDGAAAVPPAVRPTVPVAKPSGPAIKSAPAGKPASD